jgi:AcrR family transcriptional regulator
MNGPDTSRARILEAAAFMLKTRGLARTKLSDIAERAGMLAPSLYHHFRSKNQLVEEVMVEGIYRNTRHIMQRVEVLGPDASSLARLTAAITAHIDFVLTGDDFASAVGQVFHDLPDEVRHRVLAAYSTFDNYWRDLIVAAQRSGACRPSMDPTVMRKFLIAMLDSSNGWFRPGKLSAQEIARQACDLFLYGFATREPGGIDNKR